MTLDTRARRAAQGIRRAVEVMEMSTSTKEPRKVERFDRFRDRKQRNRRVGTLLVAAMLAVATIVVATYALDRRDTKVPATPSRQNGRIAFGEQDSNHLFTMNADGTDVRELSVKTECMSWAPDGSKILISTDGRLAGKLVQLATINPDGTGYAEPFDADPGIDPSTYPNLGCGSFSPDGTRIVLGAGVDGIYTVRASDGSDLVKLASSGAYPTYSPDGAQVVFEGIQGPGRGMCVLPTNVLQYTCPPGTTHKGQLDGAVFVVNVDGTGLHRIAYQTGLLYYPPSWSPDGRWILFSDWRAVYVVHPDGTGLRRIRLEDPRLRGAYYPSWSPDGTRFVFVGRSGSPGSNLFTARKDGTDVEQITHTRGIYYRSPAWGTNAG